MQIKIYTTSTSLPRLIPLPRNCQPVFHPSLNEPTLTRSPFPPFPLKTVLGPSTTQLFRNAAAALRLEAGDELVLSAVDHEANVAPWVDLAERQGLVVRWWRPSSRDGDDGDEGKHGPRLTAEDLEALLGDRTRLVACTHASNILGTIHDVKGICATVRARAPGALVCVDAVWVLFFLGGVF